MPLSPGDRFGDYEIRRPLGAGGMGSVYLAQDQKLGRNVAIKVLSGELAADHARIRRFEQEARAASALSHPNVCVVHALGETPAGQPYIAMEYVEGHTLRHVLQAEPATLKSALEIAIQVASGVGAAHAIGIVHRDLKPENVIVRPDGLVKVLDFGLAKLTADRKAADESEATRTLVQTDAGVVMGTFTYMSPEQARGKEVDARTDIWAVGVLLYELVSGRAPFAGETRSDVLAAILEREPPALDTLNPAIPHELQRIVAKALRKERTQRYQVIADLRLDLEALRGDVTSASQETAPLSQSAPATAQTRRESSAEYILTGLGRHKLAAGLLIALVAGAVVAWRLGRSRPEGTTEPAASVQRTLTRLTFGEGLQTDPTFSPDGRYLAYASDRAGNFDIWVQPVGGGEPIQITKEPEAETQPAWSPDGSTIVFRSEKDGGGLFAVPQLGGATRRLTTMGEHPVWSWNGSEVLFQVRAFPEGEGSLQFYAVPADGGVPAELGAAVLRHGRWKWVAEHPDGRISALGTHDAQGLGFYTFSREGTALVKSDTTAVPSLLSGNNFVRTNFAWNRTGTHLILEAKVNVENLWRVDVDPATLVWRSARRLTTGSGRDIDAVLSHDESRLAYVQQTSVGRLWSFPLDAAAGKLLGEGTPFSDGSLEAAGVDLSPDGSAAVYVLTRPGANQFDVWLHRFDTGASQLIAPNSSFAGWAPDGRSIAYMKFGKTQQAFMLRAPDGTERPLTPSSQALALLPGNGPTGSQTILVSAVTQSDTSPLWLWGLDRPRETPLRVLIDRPHVGVWQPRVSPNGRWLAFILEEPGTSQPGGVRLARFGDGPVTDWNAAVPGLSNSDKPRWSPDGRMLYFLTNRAGFLNLAAVHFDPDKGAAVGEPFDVTHFNSPGMAVSRHVDRTEIGVAAHRLVLTMESSTGSIWMLDNVDK
jgi:serine/threonine protein kinase/Tol biopolymer transport system component